jgi:hypothetical protein
MLFREWLMRRTTGGPRPSPAARPGQGMTRPDSGVRLPGQGTSPSWIRDAQGRRRWGNYQR